MSRRSTTSTSSSGPGPTSSACGWSGWRCPMPPTTWPTPWRHWSTSSAEAGRGGGRRDRRPHRRAGAGRGGGAGHGGGGRRAVRRQDLHLPGRRADRRGRRRLVPGRQAGRPGAVRPAGDHRPADQLPTRRPAHVRLVPGAAAGAARRADPRLAGPGLVAAAVGAAVTGRCRPTGRRRGRPPAAAGRGRGRSRAARRRRGDRGRVLHPAARAGGLRPGGGAAPGRDPRRRRHPAQPAGHVPPLRGDGTGPRRAGAGGVERARPEPLAAQGEGAGGAGRRRAGRAGSGRADAVRVVRDRDGGIDRGAGRPAPGAGGRSPPGGGGGGAAGGGGRLRGRARRAGTGGAAGGGGGAGHAGAGDRRARPQPLPGGRRRAGGDRARLDGHGLAGLPPRRRRHRARRLRLRGPPGRGAPPAGGHLGVEQVAGAGAGRPGAAAGVRRRGGPGVGAGGRRRRAGPPGAGRAGGAGRDPGDARPQRGPPLSGRDAAVHRRARRAGGADPGGAGRLPRAGGDRGGVRRRRRPRLHRRRPAHRPGGPGRAQPLPALSGPPPPSVGIQGRQGQGPPESGRICHGAWSRCVWPAVAARLPGGPEIVPARPTVRRRLSWRRVGAVALAAAVLLAGDAAVAGSARPAAADTAGVAGDTSTSGPAAASSPSSTDTSTPSSTDTSTTDTTTTTAPPAPPPYNGPPPAVPAQGALFGAHVETGSSESAQKSGVTALESAIGRKLAIDHYYRPWTTTFPTTREQWDFDNGRIPMISWAKTYADQIVSGSQDDLIRQRADAIAALGKPLLIRWFWEMDGTRNQQYSESPALYIAAWQHIVSIFRAEGASNVGWVWCPNAFNFDD